MPTFQFTSPDGQTYSIDGPDGATRDQAFQMLQLRMQHEQAPQQQEDPSLSHRVMQPMAGFNGAVANMVGAPVDAMNWALDKTGLNKYLPHGYGSDAIQGAMGSAGIATPQSAPAVDEGDRLLQAAGSGVASAMVPEAGLAAAAPATTAAAIPASLLSRQGALAAAKAALGDGSNMAATIASGAAGGVGSQAAGDATAGTPYAGLAQVLGGGLAGAAAGRLASRMTEQGPQAIKGMDEVNAARDAAYADPNLKNFMASTSGLNKLGDDMEQALNQQGFFKYKNGPVFGDVAQFQNRNGPMSFDEMESIRKSLGETANEIGPNFRPTGNAKAAMAAKKMLDDWQQNQMTSNPQNVYQGNPAAANAAITEARGNAAASIRAHMVNTRLDNANVNNSVTNSALNLGNRIRQSVAKPYLLNNEAKMAGWSPETQEMARKLGHGDTLANTMRYLGNSIGGSGFSVGPYVLLGHPVIPAVGYAMKKLGGIYATMQAKKLSNALLSEAPVNAPIVSANKTLKMANLAAAKRKAISGAMQGLAASLNAPKPSEP